MRIERHVFGNVRGYTTVARSAGVGVQVCRELESAAFSFGQTNDPRFAQGLANDPAFFIRELPGNRRCLTRVLQGRVDDSGRPTLLLISAILTRQDWDRQLFGNVQWLLDRADLWQWDGSGELAVIQLSPSPPPRALPVDLIAKLLALLSEIECDQLHGRQTVVSIDDYGPRELGAPEVLIPPNARPAVSIACDSLNWQFPARVNAPSTIATSRSTTFRYTGLLGELSDYANFLKDAGILSGTVPLEQIMAYRQFGRENFSPNPPTLGGPPAETHRPGSPWGVLLALAALSIVAAAVSYLIWHQQAEAGIRQVDERIAQLQRDSDARQAQTKIQIDQAKNQIEDLRDAIGQANQRSAKSLDEARQQIESRFSAIEKKYAQTRPATSPATQPKQEDNG